MILNVMSVIFGVNENKQFEAKPKLLKQKPSKQFGNMLPYYQAYCDLFIMWGHLFLTFLLLYMFLFICVLRTVSFSQVWKNHNFYWKIFFQREPPY